MKIRLRHAEGHLDQDVLALPKILLDLGLVTAASQDEDGTLVVDLVKQLTLKGKDADEAARAIFGRSWPRHVRWVTT
jgi:hypothetical protein